MEDAALETETPVNDPTDVKPGSGSWCSRCGRRKDPSAHDRLPDRKIEDPVTGRVRKVRVWKCRLRLVGTNHYGKTMVPSPTTTTRLGHPHTQRLVPENDARWVHESRFQNGELTT